MATTATQLIQRSRTGDKGYAHSSHSRPEPTGNPSRTKSNCQSKHNRAQAASNSAGPKQNKTKNQTPSSDYLTSYFRDLSEHKLLDPKQEREIARGIEEHEVLTWELLLSYPPISDYVIDIVEVRLDNSLKDFRQVRRMAAEARKSRTKASRAKLRKASHKAASTLRALDLDRVHVEWVIGHLDTLQVRSISSHQNKLPFSPRSRSFSERMTEIKETFGQAAKLRKDFVHANLRLVVTMARRYDHGGMPLADLIQEGNLGLMHAVSRFDYRRGLRFSTYACWWIRHAIGRALADKSRAVRIPVHMLEAQQQLQKVQLKLTSELGRQPTNRELANAAEIPISKLNQMHRYLMGQPMSLDRPLRGGEDERAFGELLTDPATEESSPVDRITTQTLTARVEQLMSHLTPIEADVLRQRFGLADAEERTFREIGDKYHLSRERIRQIQNAALGKLRRALERTL